MGGASINDIFSVLKKCLDRDRGWVAASKKALLKATKQPDLNIDAGQVALKKAFDEARYNEHTKAAATLSEAANATSDEPYKAWLKVRAAEMTNCFDRTEAQRILQSAYRLNRSVIRPAEGVAYEKLSVQKGAQAFSVQAFFRERFLEAPERILFAQSLRKKGAQTSSCAPFPSWGVPTRGRALVATQGALAAPLQRIDLEWLLWGRPVAIGEQPMVVIARDEDEPYVAGDEGIGNRRDGPALQIGVEDRKIEVGFPRRFQRLVDARSLGGDGIADLT